MRLPACKPGDALDAILKQCAAGHPPPAIEQCCVCLHSLSVRFGVFLPGPAFARRIGQPEGKVRTVVYGVCQQCFELRDRDAKVEASILERAQVQ